MRAVHIGHYLWPLLFAATVPILQPGPPVPAPPATVPPVLRPIGALLDPLESNPSQSVTLRGVVTLVRMYVIYVQDQTGAMAVNFSQPARLAIGDEVELQGRYDRSRSGGELRAFTIRKLWSGSAPVPLSLEPEQAAEGSFRGRLVDTEGRLLKKQLGEGYLRLTLEGAGQIFGANLELSSPVGINSQLAKNLEEDSVLRLVGVCAPTVSSEESVGNAFIVLMRSTDDIRVVVAPPWWNLKHAVWLAFIVIAILSGFFWIRHRSLHLRFQAIVEERSRIAREMHDTLAQGFSGLTYQLEGLARELNTSPQREPVKRHLALALDLVRHCREDAHRSIFALRSLAQREPDLLDLLVGSCSSLRARNDIRILTEREGKQAAIADATLNHLLRIGQEAITNAIQHSNATEVRVLTRFTDSGITLEVRDNGCGFDIARARPVEAGGFGITGMRERCKHIRAEFAIQSDHGAGTTVTVQAPLLRKKGRWRNEEPKHDGHEGLAPESGTVDS